MKQKQIALVKGDGSGPETMSAACAVAAIAAKKDDTEIIFKETPMGWNAYRAYGGVFRLRPIPES